uniref:GntR family transcriptional regulator n=1 Tax=Desulfatirhabdium butyrativorans TaxID=340467 RepID=A0A7C4MPW4_9BACT
MGKRVKESIYSDLRKAIIFGKLGPGERLIEIQLSQQYNCSRGPIREALSKLAQEGFVEIFPNRGASVAKISSEEVADYYSLLALLEGKAVEWATPNLNQKDFALLDHIQKLLHQSLDKEEDVRMRLWSEHNRSFHQVFWVRCGNRKLRDTVEEIRQQIFRFRYTSLMIASYNDYYKDHEEIIAAAKAGNAEEAGRAMVRHIDRAKQILNDFFTTVPTF